MEKTILFHKETDCIIITIETYFDNNDLIVEGYDIGKSVKQAFGDSDYEYSTTVKDKEVKKLYPLMNVALGDKEGLLKAIADKFNTNTCYSEFKDFLEKNGIQSEGFSWT